MKQNDTAELAAIALYAVEQLRKSRATPEQELAIAKSPYNSLRYALMIGEPFELGEPAITTSAQYSYARCISYKIKFKYLWYCIRNRLKYNRTSHNG